MAQTQAVYPPLKNDLLLRAAWNHEVERPPVWIMRQAGRYLPSYNQVKGSRDFFECCRDPETAAAITLLPIDRFDGLLDAAIIFSDILVVPQALGMIVEMDPGRGPVFPAPLRSPTDPQFEQILAGHVDVSAELAYVFAAISLTRHRLAGRVPLIGFCGGPWTLFCYMVEGSGSKLYVHAKRWIYQHPELAKQLLSKITDVCVEYLALQVKAGAQLLMVFDSNAGELSPAYFKVFCQPYLAEIARRVPERVAALQLDPVPMTVFPKGAWYALDSVCDLGYQVVGLDWLRDPAEAVRIRGDRSVVFQGNADPGVLYGTHETISAIVRDMVARFGGGKRGWIGNLGHGITPDVDPDSAQFFLEEFHRLTTP